MPRSHRYAVTVHWTGDHGTGTSDYRAYGRDHEIRAVGKSPLAGSADPAFRGDPSGYNPEELLVASLSACHMLWYLHLCAVQGIVVKGYEDAAEGTLELDDHGSGRFTQVTLRPRVAIASGDPDLARRLHDRAHELCFIANSVNFPVRHEPAISS